MPKGTSPSEFTNDEMVSFFAAHTVTVALDKSRTNEAVLLARTRHSCLLRSRTIASRAALSASKSRACDVPQRSRPKDVSIFEE